MADVNQAQAVSTNAVIKPDKTSIVEVFMKGAKKGFYLGVEQILPAMILGYVIIQFFKLTGIIDVLSVVFGPIMGIFGLPGESVVVLLSAFFSKAAGAAAAANLYGEGVLTAAQCTILVVPCMLMGTLIGHFARIILVSDVNPKHRGIMLLVPIVDSVVGMFVMKLILTVMGLM